MNTTLSIPAKNIKDVGIYECSVCDGENFQIACVGRASYIVNGRINSGVDFTISKGYAVHNLQIGQFCSIAQGVEFTMGLGHNYYKLATGVSDLFSENEEIASKSNYREKGQILIQNDVWIGNNVTVMSGVVIGNGVVVAANSHVVNDIPPYAVVGGNPAKIIKYRFDDEIIKKLLIIKWWNWSDEKIKANNTFFKIKSVHEFCEMFYDKALEVENRIVNVEISKLEHTFLYFVDFEEKYGVWENVIREFSIKFKEKDNYLLIIYIDDKFAIKNRQLVDLLYQFINEVLTNQNAKCSISVCIDSKINERAVFKNVEYFITNRSKSTIIHSEYAYENDVKIIAGVDRPIF